MTARKSKKSKKEVEPPIEILEEEMLFSFYLDAWNFCMKNKIDLGRIRKVDFRTWEIVKK
jgi:hypothetical protein